MQDDVLEHSFARGCAFDSVHSFAKFAEPSWTLHIVPGMGDEPRATRATVASLGRQGTLDNGLQKTTRYS